MSKLSKLSKNPSRRKHAAARWNDVSTGDAPMQRGLSRRRLGRAEGASSTLTQIMSITAARQASLLQGQQTIARKVFEVVPILEAWTPNQIDGALRRQTRSSIDFKVLQGCLVALKGAGLIVEPKAGTFQRVAIREKTAGGSLDEAYDEPEEFREVEDARPKGGTSEALQMLADMATHLRSLADDIEAVGLLIAEEAQQNAGSLNKLAQLQTLLKSI